MFSIPDCESFMAVAASASTSWSSVRPPTLTIFRANASLGKFEVVLVSLLYGSAYRTSGRLLNDSADNTS